MFQIIFNIELKIYIDLQLTSYDCFFHSSQSSNTTFYKYILFLNFCEQMYIFLFTTTSIFFYTYSQ